MAGGISHKSRSSSRRRVFRAGSDINITPLVDVMLVLMIIFMVTAPMMTVGVPIDLPQTKAAVMNDQVDPIIISMNSKGALFLQETEMTLPMLIGRLSAITNHNHDAKIYVRGDKALAYGQIMEVMGAISEAGFSKVSLIAQMPSSSTLSPSSKASDPKKA